MLGPSDQLTSPSTRPYGTTNVSYGTTNADAGVGIGLLKGIQKFD